MCVCACEIDEKPRTGNIMDIGPAGVLCDENSSCDDAVEIGSTYVIRDSGGDGKTEQRGTSGRRE